jgi:hypothetical protein
VIKNSENSLFHSCKQLLEPIGNHPAEKELAYYQQMEGAGHGCLTQTNKPPVYPGWFIPNL